MQVNVFVSEVKQDGSPTNLLVLPFGPEAVIPHHLHHIEWRYFATTDSGDSTIGRNKKEVEAALASDGFLLSEPGSI
jgi:hypothetical protein